MDQPIQSVNVELFLSIIVGISITALGAFVYLKDKKSWTNRLFLLLSINIVTYVIVNFISLHPFTDTPENQLFWVRLVMFTTSFLGPILLLLVYTFPREKIILKKRYFALIFALMTSSAIASLTPLVFSGISYPNGQPIPEPGSGIFIFLLDFIGLFILSFVVLIFRYLKSKGLEKKRMLFLLIGIVVSFSLMGLTTVLFVVILKTSDFIFFGPISTIFLLLSISYAIIKYRLFNIRVLATEAFTVIIWAIFSVNILTSGNPTEMGVNIFLFFLLIIFGILLIRGTRHEVKELTRLSEAKSEFVSIASHQLRTPLTAIKGFLSLVIEEDGDETLRKDWIKKAYQSNERLIRLVSDLLNISRIERGSIMFNFKKTDVLALLESLAEELRIAAEDKKLMLIVEKPDGVMPEIKMDGEKMRQVILNLVDNAINYTREGSITIKVVHLRELRRIRILVKDTGVGMTKENLENLFNIFSRGDNVRKTHVEGMGLGLYVAHKIVLAHNGKIWASSEGLRKGSTFYIELPTD